MSEIKISNGINNAIAIIKHFLEGGSLAEGNEQFPNVECCYDTIVELEAAKENYIKLESEWLQRGERVNKLFLEIQKLEAENARIKASLNEDTMRIDWMQENCIGVGLNVETGAWELDFDCSSADNIRDAIDVGRCGGEIEEKQ